MEIKVKDFTVTPAVCPAGFASPRCDVCQFAKAIQVKNPRGGSGTDFGIVTCKYIEDTIRKWERDGFTVRVVDGKDETDS